MPNRCVVGGCSNTPNVAKGIILHSIPFANDDRPQAKKRRKQWVDFVKLKRAKWEPTKNSAICSAHFAPEDFCRRFSSIPGQSQLYVPRLNRDEIGIVPSPRFHKPSTESQPESRRSRKKASEIDILCIVICTGCYSIYLS